MATASSSGALFGKFKTKVAEQFRKEDAVNVATCLDLTPAKRDEIKSAQAPGLALLECLHKNDIITEDGIGNLCDALTHCNLKRTARIAKEEFEKYKSHREKEVIEKPSPADDTDIGRTFHDPGTLKAILQDELKRQDCFELAIYFSLSEQVVNKVQESHSYAKELVEALEDRTIINERSISALLNALKDRGLLRVVNKIKKDLEQHFVTQEEKGPATPTHDGGSGDSVKCKNCGKSSFQEFKYEDKIVALECKNEECLSKWVVSPTSSSSERATINYKNETLSYKPPVRLDLSKMEYEAVKDIKELEPGDHIILRRYGMYDHHAILVSTVDSSTLKVIHWTSGWPSLKGLLKLKSDAVVSIKNEEISFPSGGVRRVVYDRQDQKELVLARAFDTLENSDQEYSVTVNNCESLATYCKSGTFYSVQGQLVKKFRPPLQQVMNLLS